MPPCASRSHREQRGKIELKVVRHTGITVSVDASLLSIMSIGGCMQNVLGICGGWAPGIGSNPFRHAR